MRSKPLHVWSVALLAGCVVANCIAVLADDNSGNLAPKAKITVSSAYSGDYRAENLADGQIPAPMGRSDVGKAWCARGNQHAEGVTISFQWPQTVTVATVVYYGRTAFHAGENWKDYEIYLDGSDAAVAKGQFQAGHGPQPVKLPEPASITHLKLKLLSNHGGPNPGASEIQVYSGVPADGSLGKFIPPSQFPAAKVPGFEPPPPPEIQESSELAARLRTGALGFTKLVLAQRYHIRASHVYTYHCEGQKDGGRLCIYDVTDDSVTPLVESPDGQIQGCDLSYDGETILFGWRRGSAYYQLYTVKIDGSNLTQLTDGDHHNYDGAWLPDGRIVFLSTRRPQAAYCFFTPVGTLYTMNDDGSNQQCISANYLNDFTPAVTNDGRIIYGRWEYVDRPAIPIQSLWTINPDGTMLKGFFGNRVLDPATFIEPQPIPGTTAILCTMTGHNGSCRGAIGIIDPSYGDNAQSAIRNLTPDVRLRGVNVSSNGPRGPYQTPYPVDGRYFLVSYDGTILLRDYDGTEQTTVIAPRGLGFYNPRPLRPRQLPPVRTSGLPDGEQEDPWAAVYLQDVYNGLAPHVQPGEVKQIAVVQELARSLINSPGIHRPAFGYQRVLVSCGATYVPKKVWGYAGVSEDGSAYFKVPAEQPIYFVALDAEGRAIQRMRSFTHLMPGEVQGCIGCHEPRSRGPHSQLPGAILGEPQQLRTPEWGLQGFCYARIVQPVLDKYCIECHNPHDKPDGIDLTGDRTDYFNISYEVLARRNQGRTGSPLVNWIPTYNGEEWNIREIGPRKWGSPASKLAELILTGHPDAEGKRRVELDDDSRRRVFMWIDLNVPYYGTADTAHPDLPACRQMLPQHLRPVMDDVYARRCQACHESKDVQALMTWRPTKWSGGRGPWGGLGVRVENPQLNDFLLAPLAKSAGGSERCGEAVFKSIRDPDYQAVLKTFEPVNALMQQTPRMDMPGAVSACCAD
jgi:mono/diheme cytochrome c family protein